MKRHLDIGLTQLNRELLSMAGHVEQAIDAATEGWRTRNRLKLDAVHSIERKVNRANIELDDNCVKLIALQQPMAADLRTIIAMIKINADLERMVDLAVNIAETTAHLLKHETLPALDVLDEMADEVRLMVRDVLDAFVRRDEARAREVLERDDAVDALKRAIFDDAVTKMKAGPEIVEPALNLLLIARNLERIGDHATNVAEDIIYIASGEDVRHGAKTIRRE